MFSRKKIANIPANLPAFLAVALLVFASSSHIHLRYCLDGNEAPVSVHFESTETHSHGDSHDTDKSRLDKADVERELSFDSLLAKIYKGSANTAAIASHDFPTATFKTLQVAPSFKQEGLPDQPATLLPPSRAPPALV